MKRVLLLITTLLVVAVAGAAVWINVGPSAHVARTLVGLARTGAGLEARHANIPGYRIAYLEGGRGEPLVLLHGFGANKDNWNYVAYFLTPHFRVIAPDLPGFGDSDKPANGRYRMQDQVEHLHAFVRALGIDSFDLGGNSMGGRIAAEYAARYPGEVKSLWLLAPAGVMSAEPSEMMERLEHGEKIPLLARTPEEFDRLVDLVMTTRPYLPPPMKRYLVARAAADYELQANIFAELGKEWRERPLEQIAKGLRTPTRIVWGARDRVLHVSGARTLSEAMPNASVLVLPLIGHVPMIEAPQVVASDFLVFRTIRDK